MGGREGCCGRAVEGGTSGRAGDTRRCVWGWEGAESKSFLPVYWVQADLCCWVGQGVLLKLPNPPASRTQGGEPVEPAALQHCPSPSWGSPCSFCCDLIANSSSPHPPAALFRVLGRAARHFGWPWLRCLPACFVAYGSPGVL